MALERKILTITKPTIAIEELSQANTKDPNLPFQSSENKFNQAGAIWPVVEINKYQFNENEIKNLYLDETGFIPTIKINVTISDGNFISNFFPKDGDPLSIYIRSKTDEFKPIRCDFEITLVNAYPSKSETGDVQEFSIEGILRVPGIYADWCNSFTNKTSYDTIINVCNLLKIGFASNEVETKDTQTWLNPFDTSYKFLNDITMASYKDDGTFFKGYIDHNYYFNFVNMNTQFSDQLDIDDALEVFAMSDDFNDSKKMEKFDTKLILTNHQSQKASGNFIKGYTLINKAGQIDIDNGYRRFMQIYDTSIQTTKPKDKYTPYFIEPLTTKGVDGKILLKGRVTEDFFSKFSKYKWLGTQYDENCHGNYIHAIVQNRQNNEEIEKMMMRVNLGVCNFNIYRGQMVPVMIINVGNEHRQKQTLDPSQSITAPVSYDKFLSGNYMVHGITFYWSAKNARFEQELFLCRREWPMPNNPAIDNKTTVPAPTTTPVAINRNGINTITDE